MARNDHRVGVTGAHVLDRGRPGREVGIASEAELRPPRPPSRDSRRTAARPRERRARFVGRVALAPGRRPRSRAGPPIHVHERCPPRCAPTEDAARGELLPRSGPAPRPGCAGARAEPCPPARSAWSWVDHGADPGAIENARRPQTRIASVCSSVHAVSTSTSPRSVTATSPFDGAPLRVGRAVDERGARRMLIGSISTTPAAVRPRHDRDRDLRRQDEGIGDDHAAPVERRRELPATHGRDGAALDALVSDRRSLHGGRADLPRCRDGELHVDISEEVWLAQQLLLVAVLHLVDVASNDAADDLPGRVALDGSWRHAPLTTADRQRHGSQTAHARNCNPDPRARPGAGL